MNSTGRTALAILRLVALSAFSLLLWAVWLVTWPLRIAMPAFSIAEHRWIMGVWGRGNLAIMGFRMSVEGPLPGPPFLLVSNHLSYTDIFLLSAVLGTRFLSKAEIASWPIVGAMARSTGTLFVDRARSRDLPRVVAEIQAILEGEQGVVFFPEGTSSPGAEVLPFRASLFEVAIRTGRQVYCASLSYATPPSSPPAHLAVCWWGDMEFFGHLFQLLRIPRTNARIVFAPEALDPSDYEERKALAGAACEIVRAGFEPVVTDPI